MCKEQCKKGLKIDKQRPAGSIAFAEPEIEKISKDRPVILAHKKIATEAMPNLMPAVVKTPIPSRLILMATALAPKSMHINTVKEAAKKEKSLFCGAPSIINLLLF